MTTAGLSAAEARRRWGYLILAGLAVLVLLAPFFALTSGYRLDIFRFAMYLGILAATWSLLAGIAGQFSFAHIAIAGLAAYASAIWVRDISGAMGGIAFGIIFATLFATVVGLLMGLLLLRLRAAYLALFTIAFAEIVRLAVVAETDLTGGRLSLAVRQLPGEELFYHYLIFGLLVLMLAIIYGLLRSQIGLFLRAMREDEEAAAAMGVHVVRLKVFVFTLTSALIGLSAAIYTHTTPRLTPDTLTLLQMGIVIAVAVIGGIESPLAAAIGGLVMFMVLENLRRIQLSAGAAAAWAAFFALGVLVLVWVIWRARRKADEPFPAALWKLTPWLAAAMVVALPVTSVPSPWSRLLAAAAITLLSVFAVLTARADLVDWVDRILPAIVVAAVLLVLAVWLLLAGRVAVDVGVWRFAVFGLVLMFTLRFAYNGLVAPLLDYFSGRREAMAMTVALRDEAEDA